MSSLLCKNISKIFPVGTSSITVLENFSLVLQQGEIGMVMGPSGCGKTTLLMIAGGILEPSQGTCQLLGQDIFNMRVKEKIAFRAAHISFVFQHLHLFPALSALENLALPLLIDGVSSSFALQKASALMIELGLENHFGSKLEILSGGQKQRIAIGRALIRTPSLVLCDEPTSNLDEESTKKVFSLMQDYAQNKGCTFLISTHDYRVTSYADNIVKFTGLNQYKSLRNPAGKLSPSSPYEVA